MKPSEVLSKAADLIEPKGAWTKGTAARNRDGDSVPPYGRDATCWCTVGAIAAASPAELSLPLPWLRKFLGHTSISAWNDAPERTQSEVVSALRKASRLAAEAGE